MSLLLGLARTGTSPWSHLPVPQSHLKLPVLVCVSFVYLCNHQLLVRRGLWLACSCKNLQEHTWQPFLLHCFVGEVSPKAMGFEAVVVYQHWHRGRGRANANPCSVWSLLLGSTAIGSRPKPIKTTTDAVAGLLAEYPGLHCSPSISWRATAIANRNLLCTRTL